MACSSGKQQYETHGQALASIRAMRKTSSRRRRRRPALFGYRCPLCAKWHVTSRPDQAKRGRP